MKSTTKRVCVIIALVAICFLAATATSAFFTRTVSTENIITFGALKMKLVETTLGPDGKESPFDTSLEVAVTQKSTQSRIVRLENLCQEDMYVRIKLETEGTDENGTTFRSDEYVTYTINEDEWAYHDGWYYYKNILSPGTTSKELMTQVIFDIEHLTDKHPGSKIKLHINAQAVQSDHQEIENVRDDYALIVGWPE